MMKLVVRREDNERPGPRISWVEAVSRRGDEEIEILHSDMMWGPDASSEADQWIPSQGRLIYFM